MSLHEELDLKEFVDNLTEKTKSNEINWKKVPKVFYNKLVDRPITDTNIRECFYSDSPSGDRVVIGKIQKKVYYEDEDYFLEDHFFITITDDEYEDPTTFLESDDMLGFSFTIIVSKMHRMIKINANNIKNRIDNWF